MKKPFKQGEKYPQKLYKIFEISLCFKNKLNKVFNNVIKHLKLLFCPLNDDFFRIFTVAFYAYYYLCKG